MAGHVAAAWILRNRVPDALSCRSEKEPREVRHAPVVPPSLTVMDPATAPSSADTPARQPSPVSRIPAPRRPWTPAVLVGVGASLWARRRWRHRECSPRPPVGVTGSPPDILDAVPGQSASWPSGQ